MLQYSYNANQLLIDCLNSSCEVTTAIQQEIETTLLFPEKELKDREWQGDLIDRSFIWVLRHRFLRNYFVTVFFGGGGDIFVVLFANQPVFY